MTHVFKKFELWQEHGYIPDGRTAFFVEVEHFILSNNDNVWMVGVYVFKNHPWFDKINKDTKCEFFDIDRSPDRYEERYNEKGECVCKKIDCDYNHLYDNRYRECSTKEDARPVFFDAERLFELFGNAEGLNGERSTI